MDKFIILYTKGLCGAIVGTESGEVLSISKEQLQNHEWLENHTSKKLKVYKTSNLDEVSNSNGTFQFIPKVVLDTSRLFVSETYKVNSDRFTVMFQGYFSSGTNYWVVEEKPFIQP